MTTHQIGYLLAVVVVCVGILWITVVQLVKVL